MHSANAVTTLKVLMHTAKQPEIALHGATFSSVCPLESQGSLWIRDFFTFLLFQQGAAAAAVRERERERGTRRSEWGNGKSFA